MDLYNIPGDDGKYWRTDKLIEYKSLVDYVDISTLSNYALKDDTLTKDDLVLCAWYFSMTYSEVTAFWLLDNLDFYGLTKSKLKSFWEEYKPIMPFSSSRVYCKSMNWFVPLMEKFVLTTKKKPYRWLRNLIKDLNTPEERYEKIFNTLKDWKFMGRFSTELFLLALDAFHSAGKFVKIQAYEPPFSWKNGSNVTSGMLNLIYLDELANEFDKNGTLDKSTIKKLDEGLIMLNDRCKYRGFKQESYSSILPRICSYRNLFKCNRYAGFHHDRQLSQLLTLKNTDTNIQSIDKIFDIRKEVYPKILLGEVCGWTGIRPERKKLFVKKGVLGIEEGFSEYKRL